MRRTPTRPVAVLLAVLLALAPAGCSRADYDTAADLADMALDALDAHAGEEPAAPSAGSPADGTAPAWDAAAYPDYIAVTGPADFDGVDLPQAGAVTYSQPDMLGRSGRAVGVITKTLRDEGSARDRRMPDTITGWPSPNPKAAIRFADGSHYKGYLFNKSHLIAKSLGGTDKPDNMVTGTRTQNVGRNDGNGGMAYAETRARDWLDAHPDGTVAYMATPVYEGDELLPRYVTVDMRTSDGTLDEHVIVFNTADGYDIDYLHGGVL